MLDRLPFRRVIVCDTEYVDREDGNPVLPVVLVAREVRSGQEWRQAIGGFGSIPPFPTDKDTLFVSYSAPAELSVFSALGWTYPARILDLFAEHRNNINGYTAQDLGFPGDAKDLWKQRGAMLLHGLDPTPAVIKEALYDRMRDGPSTFTRNELVEIMDTCALDVRDLTRLLERMLPKILARPHGLMHALNRGTSMVGTAAMQATGVPIDKRLFHLLVEHWDQILDQIAAEANRDYPFLKGRTVDQEQFAKFLARHRIAWPRTETGRLCTDKDTFKDMARGAHHALLNPLRETLSLLGQMRLNDLRVGSDARNRCGLKPFWAKTGRNQPSSSQYIFGPSTALRGMIKPPPGRAVIYADWRCQEIGIEAVCSQDQAMLADLASRDFYIGFGVRARVLPPDATEATHAVERTALKQTALGVGYGMQKKSLAERLAITSPEAKELLQLHRRTYPRFWQWNDDVVHYGTLHRKIWTTFGWELNITAETKIQTMRNYLMQANASEMLRLACYRFVAGGGPDRGFLLAGPVHDALLVECAVEDVPEAAAYTRAAMEGASRTVLGGFTLGVDLKVWRDPQRFMDEKRGRPTWRKIMRHLARVRDAQARPAWHASARPIWCTGAHDLVHGRTTGPSI